MSLSDLESKTIYLLREVKSKFQNPLIMWSMGKDSTTLMWIIRKAFMGEIPWRVLHIDTGEKFPEMYNFRHKYAKEWNMRLTVGKSESVITPRQGRYNCCMIRKIGVLKKVIAEGKHDAVLVSIRRDEHGIRNKERYISPRDKDFKWNVSKKKEGGDSGLESLQNVEFAGWDLFESVFKDANHVRVHPLLQWTELDIWKYIKQKNIPVNSLYFSKSGRRFRSLGCIPCTIPVNSKATNLDQIIDELKKSKDGERSGRAQDKEDAHSMEKLRALGYM